MALLIVTGPPGAGKTTLGRALVDRFEPSVLVEGDAFFGFLAKGAIRPWLPGSDDQNLIVIQAAAAATSRYAAGGFMTVFDGVIGPWSLPDFVESTGLRNAEYLILLPTLEHCVERVRSRRSHMFSDEAATRQMHQAFADSEIDQRHVLRDPAEDLDRHADLVIAVLESGQLSYEVASPHPHDNTV